MSTPNELSGPSPPADPLALLARWIAEAGTLRVQPNPNAMVLATCDADGRPSARVVLCKDVTSEPGYLTFYTNYQSRKGRELEVRGRAAAVFHWDALHRQARIEGPVVQAPSHESDAYFASRPWPSRIGAWASAQSQVTDSRAALERSLAAAAVRFGAPLPGSPEAEGPFAGTIPRPAHWGGYRQGRSDRAVGGRRGTAARSAAVDAALEPLGRDVPRRALERAPAAALSRTPHRSPKRCCSRVSATTAAVSVRSTRGPNRTG
jgi:pyridoxamine 5'-phosphate oxidase